MKNNKIIIILLVVFVSFSAKAQVKTYTVKSFDKIIVSPHIEVILQQGDAEKVEVNEIFLPVEKLNVEIEGKNTLRVYLDDAKMVTKNEKEKHKKYKNKKPIYKGKQVTVSITYKTLDVLSVRGEEKISFATPLHQKELTLRAYGEPRIYLNDVQLESLKTTIYGESYVEATKGFIKKQRFTNYGESVINTEAIENNETKITAYGESNYKLNVAKRLKVTAYGEAVITYKGDPRVYKGIVIGDATITHLN